MFVVVQLLNGFQTPLWYKIPENLVGQSLLGTVVRVPLQNRKETALVVRQAEQLDAGITFKIKEFLDLEGFPSDTKYNAFIEKIARFYFIDPLHFYQRIRNFLSEAHDADEILESHEKEVLVSSSAFLQALALRSESTKLTSVSNGSPEAQEDPSLKIALTEEQQPIVDYVSPIIEKPIYAPTLIHGVTGSGKTEVYKRLIIKAIEEKKTVILILPEVSLSLQFQRILQQQLPNIPIVSFHSATKIAEKRSLWQGLLERTPLLIIGVHLPILLPIANLGLIIVDEEHEHGFQEKKHPKVNSKEVAIWRASIYQIPIVLGSATPSLLSLASVERNNWKFFQIKKRFAGAFPKIKKVILTGQTRSRNVFWISNELETGVRACLARKEQAIIYLNRRGYSFFVQCKECGFIFQCPHCAVSLTLHVINKRVKKSNLSYKIPSVVSDCASNRIESMDTSDSVSLLRCHYCDYNKPLPTSCSGCKAPEKYLLKKGIGTQQLVQIFRDVFPGAIIERADMDSTTKKRSWHNTVTLFEQGKIDILIGTQTITKGYNFPLVTLVGILWADLNLHFPVYNAAETTLQQIIQVAGRAGRYRNESNVIVQVMHDHPVFDFIDEQSYLNYCKQELEVRKEIGYPPYGRLVYVELKSKNADHIERDAQILCDQLVAINDRKKLQVTILGPSFPVVSKVKNYEMRHIFLKSASYAPIHELINGIDTRSMTSDVYVMMSQ